MSPTVGYHIFRTTSLGTEDLDPVWKRNNNCLKMNYRFQFQIFEIMPASLPCLMYNFCCIYFKNRLIGHISRTGQPYESSVMWNGPNHPTLLARVLIKPKLLFLAGGTLGWGCSAHLLGLTSDGFYSTNRWLHNLPNGILHTSKREMQKVHNSIMFFYTR